MNQKIDTGYVLTHEHWIQCKYKLSVYSNVHTCYYSSQISTLMGFTWLIGFVAAYVKNAVVWYIFVIFNSLQGTFIFLAFMCNLRVWRLWTQGITTKSTSTSIRKSSNVCADPSAHEMPYPSTGGEIIGTVNPDTTTNREEVITKM